MYGKEVPRSCHALCHIGEKMNSSSLGSLLKIVDESNICSGNFENHLVSMVEMRKGVIKTANGDLSAYLDESLPVCNNGSVSTKTVRSSCCELITNQSKCTHCVTYRKNLRALYARCQKESSPTKRKRSEADSHTNYRYLRTPEKKARITNLHNKTKSLCRQVDQLKKKIEHLTELNGVNLEHSIDSDIRDIVNENDAVINASYSPESFECLFWKQQKESMLIKNAKQMRWHPMLIKWCIHLRMLSSSCYNSLRSAGVLRLPSERTLRDYTNVIKSRSGFQCEVDEQLLKEAKLEDSAEHRKYVSLVFDEVKIKEDLVYNKHTGELIGFVNITDINHHLTAFEHHCHGEVHSHEVATHMLVFMVRGLFTRLKFPYVQFSVATASGDILHPIVWQCIEHLEMVGIKVLALVCDGASTNRKFFRMHGKLKELTYKVTNIYADEPRPIFFISDVPHLIKTTRNSWANSCAHTNTRKLWVCHSIHV